MKKSIIGLLALALPLSVAAQTYLPNTREFIESIGGLIRLALPIVAGLALLYFFWGLAKFIQKSGDEKAHTEGKNKMIWGIVTLFVMLSVWGLVAFIQHELGINPNAGAPTLPNLPGLSGTSGTPGPGDGDGGGFICPPCSNFPNPDCPDLEVC